MARGRRSTPSRSTGRSSSRSSNPVVTRGRATATSGTRSYARGGSAATMRKARAAKKSTSRGRSSMSW